MVTEFTQHPAGIIEAGRADVANGVMNLKFTRLKKSETASLCLPEQFQQCEHYTGPQKLDPPNLKQTVSPLSDVAHMPLVLQRPKTDVAWLKQFTSDTKPLDWGGYNAHSCKSKDPIRVQSIVGYASITSRYNADHYGVHGQSHAELWDGVHNSDL